MSHLSYVAKEPFPTWLTDLGWSHGVICAWPQVLIALMSHLSHVPKEPFPTWLTDLGWSRGAICSWQHVSIGMAKGFLESAKLVHKMIQSSKGRL